MIIVVPRVIGHPADYIPSWPTEGREPGRLDTNVESSYRASAAGERYTAFVPSVWPIWTAAHIHLTIYGTIPSGHCAKFLVARPVARAYA